MLTNNKYQDGIIFGVSAMIGSILLRVTGLIDLEFTFPIMFFISITVIFGNAILLTLDIDKRLSDNKHQQTSITKETDCENKNG